MWSKIFKIDNQAILNSLIKTKYLIGYQHNVNLKSLFVIYSLYI